jgi:hypothetical protein
LAALPVLAKFKAEAKRVASLPAPQMPDYLETYTMNERETQLALVALIAIRTAEAALERLDDVRTADAPFGDEASYQYCGSAYMLYQSRSWVESTAPAWVLALVNEHIDQLSDVAAIARSIDA